MQENFVAFVNVELFVRSLCERYCKEQKDQNTMKQRYSNIAVLCKNHMQEVLQYGYRKGWLEAQDVLSANRFLERKDAARIVHQFLKVELREPDEMQWDAAKKLLDIYDCRVCVNHVAQVYCKGIMSEIEVDDGRKIFGMQRHITNEEANSIIERVFVKSMRNIPLQKGEKRVNGANKLSMQQAQNLMNQKRSQRGKEVILIDVRRKDEYDQEHLQDAVHCPMTKILDKEFPYSDKLAEYFLYCDQSYQSEIAANYLFDHGYENVYYFGKQID